MKIQFEEEVVFIKIDCIETFDHLIRLYGFNGYEDFKECTSVEFIEVYDLLFDAQDWSGMVETEELRSEDIEYIAKLTPVRIADIEDKVLFVYNNSIDIVDIISYIESYVM